MSLLSTLVAFLLTQVPLPAADAGGAPVPPAAPAPRAAPTRDAGVAPGTATGGPAARMEPAVAALVERMQAFYEKTQDFEAAFRQEYRYKTSRRTQTSSGKVTFRKPGLMRWEYEKPSPRTFVLAGDKVYAHDPAAMTLTVGRVDTSQLSASVTFLFGRGKLAEEFRITETECKECQGVLLVLDPLQPDPRFRQVRLVVDPASAQVLRSTVVDPDGSENTIHFLALKTNVGLPLSGFRINPPEGTRVDDFTTAGQAPQPKP